MSKFGKYWKQYRALIIIILSVTGVGAPVATGLVTLGDAVATEQVVDESERSDSGN